MKKNLLISLKQLLKALGGNDSNKTNIVGVVDEITEQVSNKDSGGNSNYSNLIFNPDNYPKPVIDGVECEQIWVKLYDSIGPVLARIADIETINDLSPFCIIENDGSWFYQFMNYDLLDAETPPQLDTAPEDYPELQACLKENITIIGAGAGSEACVLFPSNAKFGFAYIDISEVEK